MKLSTRPGGCKHNKSTSDPGGLRRFTMSIGTNNQAPSFPKKVSGGKYGRGGGK